MTLPPSAPIVTDAALATMTKARFGRLLKGLTFLDRYPLEKRRQAAILAARAAKLAHPLYIVEPHEHGNGGWSGSAVLDVVERADVFSIDPVRAYLDCSYRPAFGSRICACKTPDPNEPLFHWDHTNEGGEPRWLNADGGELTGKEGRAEAAARLKRTTRLRRAYGRIKAKLTPAERKLVRFV